MRLIDSLLALIGLRPVRRNRPTRAVRHVDAELITALLRHVE